MRTYKIYLAASILALSLAPALAIAQSDPPKPEVTPDAKIEAPKVEEPAASSSASGAAATTPMFMAAQPAGDWLISEWTGRTVMNTAGDSVGDINDILIDSSGKVSAVVVGVGGFLGLGEKNVAIAFNSLKFEDSTTDGRMVRVSMSRAELESAPAFVTKAAADANKKLEEPNTLDEPAAVKPAEPPAQ